MPLTKDMPASTWIHDFVNSDNPKFRGKSKEERRKMALGAYYGKQNEETELDEAQNWVWSFKRHKKNLERVHDHWGILHDRGFSGKKTYHVGHIDDKNRFFHSGVHTKTGESKFHPTFDSSHEAKKYIKANKDSYKPHSGPWLGDTPHLQKWNEEAVSEAITTFKMADGSDAPGHQGIDPDHAKHPYHETITKHGYKYSHSTPIHYPGGEVKIHHTYKGGAFSPNGRYTDHHNVSVVAGSNRWDTSRGSATGRSHSGGSKESLEKHLASKRGRYKELREENILEGYYVVHYKVPGKGKDAQPAKMLRVVKAETEDHARKAHSDEMGKQEHSVSHVSRLQEDNEIIDHLVETNPTYVQLRDTLKTYGIAEDMIDDVTSEFGDVLLEAKTDHAIPHLGKWHTYAGGTAGGGKTSYAHYLNDGEEGKPASHTQYTITPVTHPSGRFSHYSVGSWSPKAGHSHRELGRVRNPREGVELSRKHYDENFSKVNEELINEGRPSQRHPLEGHDYHKKSEAELRYIQKDAGAAAEAMRGHDAQAEGKYADQVHDAGTVLHFRRQHNNATEVHQMPAWYQKKYAPKKVEEGFVVRGDRDGYNVVNSETGKVVSRSKSWVAAHLSKKSLSKSVHNEEARLAEMDMDESVSPEEAHKILKATDTHDKDFFTLSPSKVGELLDHADRVKYRKPKNANGSRGRYFHAMLKRKAHHVDSSINEEKEESLGSIAGRHGYTKQAGTDATWTHPSGHRLYMHDSENPHASWSHYAGKNPSHEHRYLPPPYPGKKGSKASYQKVGYGHKELSGFLGRYHGVKEETEQVNEKELSVPEKHQLKIAKQTMKMNPIMAKVMGGMSHEEAKALLKKHGIPIKEEIEQANETASEADILFQHGNHDIRRAKKGFEVYKNEGTHAVRVATIGYEGQKGLDRAKEEVIRRESKQRNEETIVEGELKLHPSMSQHIAKAMIEKLKKKKMVKEDVTGPTRMQMQNYFEKHTGPTQREKINATEKAFQVKNIKVNSKGEIVSHDKN